MPSSPYIPISERLPPTPPPPRRGVSKWVWAAVVAGVVVFSLLAGAIIGSGQDEPAVETTAEPTKSAEPSPEPTASAAPIPALSDEVYLEMVRDTYPVVTDLPDELLLGVSKTACSDLDKGMHVEDMLFNALEEMEVTSNGQAAVVGGVIGMGVENYCPQYLDEVTSGYLPEDATQA